jgi:membrane associated rhomboid family serine protease
MSEELVLLWAYLLFSSWAAVSYFRRRQVFGVRFLVSILLVAAVSGAGLQWPAIRSPAFLAATAGFVLFLLLPGLLVGIARRAAGAERFGTARRLLSVTVFLAPTTFLANERDLYHAAHAREVVALEIAGRIRARQAIEHSRTGLAIAIGVTAIHLVASLVGDTRSPLTLLTLGANHLPLVREGEWHRLVTAMFLHAGLLHLFLNATAIWIVGRWVEPKLGGARTWLVFVIGGLVGNLVSLIASAQVAVPVPSVGASGGALALLGAVIPVALRSPAGPERSVRLKTTAFIIGATFFLGFVEPAIDDGAHLGGLLAGAILGLLFTWRPLPKFAVRTAAALAFLVVAVAGGLAVEGASRWSRSVDLETREFSLRYPGFLDLDERPDGWHLSRPPLAEARITMLSCPVGLAVPAGFTAVDAPPGWVAFRGLRALATGPEWEYVYRRPGEGTGRMAHLRFLFTAEDPLLLDRFVTPVVQSFRFR